jgi:hypothetical protein
MFGIAAKPRISMTTRRRFAAVRCRAKYDRIPPAGPPSAIRMA